MKRLVAAIIAILLVAGGVGYAIAGLAKSDGQHEVQAPVKPEPGSAKAPQKSLKKYYGQ